MSSQHDLKDPQYDFNKQLSLTSRTLFSLLVNDSEHFRFLKFRHARGGYIKCTCGIYNQEGLPEVAFSDGYGLWECLRKLERNLKDGRTYPDQFASPDEVLHP